MNYIVYGNLIFVAVCAHWLTNSIRDGRSKWAIAFDALALTANFIAVCMWLFKVV